MDLINWATKQPNLDLYRIQKNSLSLDGLPGLVANEKTNGSKTLFQARRIVSEGSFEFGVCIGVAMGMLLGTLHAAGSGMVLN